MALLPPTQIKDMSTEGKKARAKAQIQERIQISLNVLTHAATDIFFIVFNNKEGLLSQEVFDALGTDAAVLHGLLGSAKELVNQVSPGSLNLIEPPLTVNEDGSITVNE